MNILEIPLEDLELEPDTTEWLEKMGPLKNVGDLINKFPDPFAGDEDLPEEDDINSRGAELCQMLGYYIWSKYGWNR